MVDKLAFGQSLAHAGFRCTISCCPPIINWAAELAAQLAVDLFVIHQRIKVSGIILFPLKLQTELLPILVDYFILLINHPIQGIISIANLFPPSSTYC
jgi:hypothetical protein